MIRHLIKRNRDRIADEIGRGGMRGFSAAHASRIRVAERLLAQHARGRVLDVGCGHMPFRTTILQRATAYEGLDHEARVPGVTYVTSAIEMRGVPEAAFDTVVCFEVLEHLPDPAAAMASIARVLRPGGTLVLTVPHLSRLHEEPHDYYRYTHHGLRVLAERAGLEVVELAGHAGLLSFLGHQLSTILLGLTWGIPVVRWLAYGVNRIVLVELPLWLDRVFRLGRLFPLGYYLVARRPSAGAVR